MTYNLKKAAISAAISATFGVSSIVMADVQQSTNGQGDLHFAPAVMAQSGYGTEISLINTSRYRSTVTKVVMRSKVQSKECLDFLVYLSPGDRFTGSFIRQSDLNLNDSVSSDYSVPSNVATAIMANVTQLAGETLNGSDLTSPVVFFSTDDSVRNTIGGFASVAAPAVYPVQDGDVTDDGCQLAYAEAIQSASYDVSNANTFVSVLNSRVNLVTANTQAAESVTPITITMFADDLTKISTKTCLNPHSPALIPVGTVNKCRIYGAHEEDRSNASKAILDTTDWPVNTTVGHYTISSLTSGLSMSSPMDAYQDYDNNSYLRTSAETMLGSNTAYDANTFVRNVNFPVPVGITAGMYQLETAMAKQNIVFPHKYMGDYQVSGTAIVAATTSFQEGTFSIVTFPTKLTEPTNGTHALSSYDSIFDASVPMTAHIRDMQERILDCNIAPPSVVEISPPPPTISCQAVGSALPDEFNLYDIKAVVKSFVDQNSSVVSAADRAALANSFAKGWTNINLPTLVNLSYAGAPAVAAILDIRPDGLGGILGTIRPASYTKGDLTIAGINGCDPYPLMTVESVIFGYPENNNPPGNLQTVTCTGTQSIQQ